MSEVGVDDAPPSAESLAPSEAGDVELREVTKHFGDVVAVDGISLTIAALADDHFDVAIIPKTWQATNLSSLYLGDAVNLEADVIAKYVERLLSESRPAGT